MLARAAMLGILAGCAHHRETAHVTVAPVRAPSVVPIAGALFQPSYGHILQPDSLPSLCDIDPSTCDKSSCAGHP